MKLTRVILLALAFASERRDHPNQIGGVVLGVGLAFAGPVIYALAARLRRRARRG